jgi:lambda family phage portal protein
MNLVSNIARRAGLLTREDLERETRIAFRRGRSIGSRAYAAAQMNRLLGDWLATSTSIDNDIRAGLVPIRERARELTKNDAHAKKFLRLHLANVVGPFGFKLLMNIKEPSPDLRNRGRLVPDKIANQKIQDAWNEWTKPENCSVTRKHSYRSICNLLELHATRDGEALLRMVETSDNIFGLRLQVIPPEMLDEKYNGRLTNGNVVVMGVEMDAGHRPIAYWLRKVEPELMVYGMLQYGVDRQRIPASELIHGFDPEHSDQTRGISLLAPVMKDMHNRSGYEEATVVQARAAATQGGFITSKSEEAVDFRGDEETEEGDIVIEMEPGTARQLEPGLDFKPWDPKFPSGQHEMFMRTCGQKESSGLDVSYASLTGDLSEANYGSNRVGMLEERESWKLRQEWFTETFNIPVFNRWLELALLKAIDLPTARIEKYRKPTFTGRRWTWIQPQQDQEAELLARKMGDRSPFDAAAERGEDLEQIYDDIAEAKQMAEDRGLSFDLSNVKPGGNTSAPQPAPTPPGKNGKKQPAMQVEE